MTSRIALNLVALVVLPLAGCGGGSELTSVTITPATADARNFPNGPDAIYGDGKEGVGSHSGSTEGIKNVGESVRFYFQ